MSEDCGEPLGRLEWRFWSPPAAKDSPADGERPASPVVAQGASPFLPSPPSPVSQRSLSSSMENRTLKRWHKRSSQIFKDRASGRSLVDIPVDTADFSPPATRPARSASDLCDAGLKLPVLPPSTFPIENVIVADDWTVVRRRRRRPTPDVTPASRSGDFKCSSSLVWTKRLNGRPACKASTAVRPISTGLNPLESRRSGLHRILGFHWNSHRGAAPAARRDRQVPMAGRPPTGGFGTGGRGPVQPVQTGPSRQINGGSFSGNSAGANGGFGGNGPQGGGQSGFASMTFGAGSGSSSQLGGQGNIGNFGQPPQGGGGGNFFPVQQAQGNQGLGSTQGNFNAGSGFPGNGPRRGGQGGGYQRPKNYIPRGGANLHIEQNPSQARAALDPMQTHRPTQAG
jgi:hypothetical protein